MDGLLPNFLIIGAMKAGTTSLAAWLGAHPDVHIPPDKELHYFNNPNRYAAGLHWYRSQFAGVTAERAIGEATPGYMAHPDVPGRIRQVLPDIRMIAILRHPAERIYSQYQHLRAVGREQRTFAQVVDEELTGTAPAFAFYLQRGRYVEHIHKLRSLFPTSALRLVLFEDLASDPQGVFADACRFIGVDLAQVPANVGKVYNPRMRVRSVRLRTAVERAKLKGQIPRTVASLIGSFNQVPDKRPAEPMDEALRSRLVDAYLDQIPELEKILGRDLSAWRR